MKRFYIIAIISFLFTIGCFDLDIVHYVEPKKDRSLFIKFRVTSIYFKDQTDKKTFNNDVIKGNLPDEKDTQVTYQWIENDLTAGVEITTTAKPHSTISATDKFPVIPYRDKFGQYIFIYHNYQELGSSQNLFDSQKIAEGLLAASKYRLAFGNTVPKQALIIVNREQPEKFNLSIYQLGNIYCIDIPMNLIIMNESAVIVSCASTINDSEISNYLTKLFEKRKEEEKKHEELKKQENNENDATNNYNDSNNEDNSDKQFDNNHNNDEHENTDDDTDNVE